MRQDEARTAGLCDQACRTAGGAIMTLIQTAVRLHHFDEQGKQSLWMLLISNMAHAQRLCIRSSKTVAMHGMADPTKGLKVDSVKVPEPQGTEVRVRMMLRPIVSALLQSHVCHLTGSNFTYTLPWVIAALIGRLTIACRTPQTSCPSKACTRASSQPSSLACLGWRAPAQSRSWARMSAE